MGLESCFKYNDIKPARLMFCIVVEAVASKSVCTAIEELG